MAAPDPGTYTIDPRRSRVVIHATSSVHPIEIRSNSPEGDITITADGGSGSLVIPVTTLRGDSPLHEIELRRQIQARRFKSIEATLRDLQHDGDGFSAQGDITFFGNTHSATGRLAIDGAGDEISITGEARFDVTVFGFNPPNILGMKVHDEITVQIDLVATRP